MLLVCKIQNVRTSLAEMCRVFCIFAHLLVQTHCQEYGLSDM